jgi:hypothetical protein
MHRKQGGRAPGRPPAFLSCPSSPRLGVGVPIARGAACKKRRRNRQQRTDSGREEKR